MKFAYAIALFAAQLASAHCTKSYVLTFSGSKVLIRMIRYIPRPHREQHRYDGLGIRPHHCEPLLEWPCQ